MYEELNEPVDVIAVFQDHQLKPLRFRWKGRTHKIVLVSGRWKSVNGDRTKRHFSATDRDDNVFELIYDERTTAWVLGKVWTE